MVVAEESEVAVCGPAACGPACDTPRQDDLVSLDILRVIREAQQQHGLRHGDFQRYRGYCGRRLRRLRRALHLPQGDRRHYRRRDVSSDTLVPPVGARLLCVVLVQAERAWAHAMQLRHEANTEPRKRYSLVRRLRKAARHAAALLLLTQSGSCCARTRLEAQAYSAGLAGALLLELQAWSGAHDQLARARLVYTQLAGTLPPHEQQLYLDKAEELQPSLRYCAYNIGDETAAADLRDLRARGLTSDIDTLLAQAQAAKAGGVREVRWRGGHVVVSAERVRPLLANLQELEPALAAAPDIAAKLRLLDSALVDCKEAAAAVREHLRTRGGEDPLLAYLAYLRLELTARRNLLLAHQAEQRVPVRARDLVRLYEILLHNYTELRALPDLAGDAEHAQDMAARLLACRALRAFYIAQLLVGLRRWREALALLDRATAQAREAERATPPPEIAVRLRELAADVVSCRVEVHANSLLVGDEDDAVEGVRSHRTRVPLALRLDEPREEVSALTRAPGVCALPPPPEPLACKPLLFDLACNLLEFPSLDMECGAAPRAGLGRLVKGLLGWGARQ